MRRFRGLTGSSAPRRPVSKRRDLALVALAAGLILAACGKADAPAYTGEVLSSTPTGVVASPPDVLAQRGQIVEQSPLSGFDDPDRVIGQATHAVYRSTSGLDGGVREVSGAFFVPPGSPPAGGWRVVSIGHGTTGIGVDCGPSQDNDLKGFGATARAYLKEGYAVAFTDYEGLGHPGRHPYLEPHTEAYNVIDAVRALRNVFPAVSEQWVAVGQSQGGQAVWAADEVAAHYADGLDFRGSVAFSPAANLTAVADLAYAGSVTRQQSDLLPLIAAGLARYNPQLLQSSLVPRLTPAQETAAFSCTPEGEALLPTLIPKSSIRTDDVRSMTLFRDALRRIALPQVALSAPLLVATGLDDPLVMAPWVTRAVADACRLGGQVFYVQVAGADHGDLGSAAYKTASEWIKQRFAGEPAPSNCGREPETLSVS